VPADTGDHLGIRALAGLAARAIAVELVLFEAFGRWISTTSHASAKPMLAAAARRHAWHAELWRERFPTIADVDVDEAIAAARSHLSPLVDALAVFDALSTGPGRLAVVEVAATALERAYRTALAANDPQLDAPTARVITLVLADLDVAAGTTGELDDDEQDALDALRAAAPFPALMVS
jgi:hypothetical protein